MANSSQARKRIRRNNRFNIINTRMRSKMRTLIKVMLTQINSKDKDSATETFKKIIKLFGRMTYKKILHKNTASRLTSRLNQRLKALS